MWLFVVTFRYLVVKSCIELGVDSYDNCLLGLFPAERERCWKKIINGANWKIFRYQILLKKASSAVVNNVLCVAK